MKRSASGSISLSFAIDSPNGSRNCCVAQPGEAQVAQLLDIVVKLDPVDRQATEQRVARPVRGR